MSENLLPPILPYLDGPRGRWDHAQADWANRAVANVEGDVDKTAALLTRFIFETHPDVLDLPPAVHHRWEQSTHVIGAYKDGERVLTDHLIAHYEHAGQKIQQGYTTAQTVTIQSADQMRPGPVVEHGMLVQNVTLPDSVQHKALRWNQWVQQTLKDPHEGPAALFGNHPAWVGAKLGDGAWLSVGNLMVEIAEGLARVRTTHHQPHNVEDRWNLGTSHEWGDGLDYWFIMTHLKDKALLHLASRLGQHMIDGMQLTPQTYARSYVPIRQLMEQNQHLAIRGVLSDGTWAYSSELSELFPDQAISGLHDIAGDVVDLGPAADLGMDAQIEFATRDPRRREAFYRGEFNVHIASRFIDYDGMGRVLDSGLHR